MNIEDNAANTAQNQGFCSIAEIEEYKSRVKEDIQDDEAKIASLWNSLFHKEESTMPKTPVQKIISLANLGTGILDGVILGWKLYRKFHGFKSKRRH